MTLRARKRLFAALLVVCLLATGVAIAAGVRQGQPRLQASEAARGILPASRDDSRAMVLFRSLDPKGQLALASAAGGAAEPTYAPLSCDRAYFAAGRGLCVARGGGFGGGITAKVFGSDLRVQHELSLEGIPSRARVSPDGRYGTVTAFVTGHSYAAQGEFSTATTLVDMERGEEIANLEDFTVTRGGKQITAVDVNFWGVTFARDADRFYATLATGGRTYLIEGSVADRVAHVVHENVECPSLSPDGTRIAYKRRTGSDDAPWRLTVLDLETMQETPLAETRSLDDQAEWLDDEHVLYGLDDQVWSVPADGSGEPERYLDAADSPSVVRW